MPGECLWGFDVYVVVFVADVLTFGLTARQTVGDGVVRDPRET